MLMKRNSLALLLGCGLFLGGCGHDSDNWRVGTRLYKNNTYVGTITSINGEKVTMKTPGLTAPGFSHEPIIEVDDMSHLTLMGVRSK
jgi:hypothetical protein